ncbi:hypothetical protein C1645_840969 [Glomus cerebriforme]|uniref:Uncharacterized protein n=1 Tax=Glomus cerebriforme TaxID=658196 RepID=A0A397S5Q8_9GLOM|nr:hypothetical protein C1645_840969 [Glomus cerebriforme]
MDITFNEIVSKSIDMIIDQLNSTHLSESSPISSNDQLSTRYSPSSTSTGVLDKSHSFTPSNTPYSQVNSSLPSLSFDANVAVQRAQVTIKKDPCIKNIKAIRHKKEYLKSIKAEESSSNRSQHALSPPLEYTYDGFISIKDINVNYCSSETVPSIIVKFSKHEGLVKAANYFKYGHHTGRMKLIPKTYYRMGRDKMSCREFKVINIPINVDLDILTKNQTPRIYSLPLRVAVLAIYSNRHGKFSGFSPTHNLTYIKNHLQDITSLKNVYKRDDDQNIYFEFASESDLFNTCSTNLFIDNLKIKGVPRGTNWSERDAFLNSRCSKRPKTTPAPPNCATGSNRIHIASPKEFNSSSFELIDNALISNPWNIYTSKKDDNICSLQQSQDSLDSHSPTTA